MALRRRIWRTRDIRAVGIEEQRYRHDELGGRVADLTEKTRRTIGPSNLPNGQLGEVRLLFLPPTHVSLSSYSCILIRPLDRFGVVHTAVDEVSSHSCE